MKNREDIIKEIDRMLKIGVPEETLFNFLQFVMFFFYKGEERALDIMKGRMEIK